MAYHTVINKDNVYNPHFHVRPADQHRVAKVLSAHFEPGYTPPPPPSLNGGLYTGEPFLPGAPWRNVPVVPDASYLTHFNLRSANPPTDALFQYPGGGHRPGNNYTRMFGIKSFSPQHKDVLCAPCIQDTSKKPKFSRFYYLT
jgi:hypothetical protein